MTALSPWPFEAVPAGRVVNSWRTASDAIEAQREASPSPEELSAFLERNRTDLLRWEEPASPPQGWDFSPQRLRVLRHLTLLAQRDLESGDDSEERGRRRDVRQALAYRWVSFLISDESSSRSYFLQHRRAKDETFFESKGLRPKRRAAWPTAWGTTLEWLHSPQSLTVAELELVLAIFEWEGRDHQGRPAPRLVWWMRRSPHILWRIHAFLLKRYCFPLLGPLRQAARAAGLRSPRFRAGEFWRFYPRVGGLCALGMLGLASLAPALALLFAAPWPAPAAAGSLAAGLLWMLIGIDVCKQNRGIVDSWNQVQARIWSLWWRSLAWGLAVAVAYAAVAWSLSTRHLEAGALHSFDRSPGASSPLSNLLLPEMPGGGCGLWRFAGGLLATGGIAALLGALLQWFWEDRALTETI